MNSSHGIVQENVVMAIQQHIFKKNKHNSRTISNLITNITSYKSFFPPLAF